MTQDRPWPFAARSGSRAALMSRPQGRRSPLGLPLLSAEFARLSGVEAEYLGEFESQALGPLSIGGLPAPSCSRRPVSRIGSLYRRLPFREQADSKAPTDLIPDNGQVERMNRTIQDARAALPGKRF